MNPLAGKIRVDFRSGEPIYLQIAGQIEHLIAQGDLKLGDQLPTVRELATELKVNWNTVARSYRLLDESHLISTQRGRGTYVWEKPSEATLRKLRQESLEELTRQYLDDAARLGFAPEDIVETAARLLAGWQNGSQQVPDKLKEQARH